jgi:hypothetical protein
MPAASPGKTTGLPSIRTTAKSPPVATIMARGKTPRSASSSGEIEKPPVAGADNPGWKLEKWSRIGISNSCKISANHAL